MDQNFPSINFDVVDELNNLHDKVNTNKQAITSLKNEMLELKTELNMASKKVGIIHTLFNIHKKDMNDYMRMFNDFKKLIDKKMDNIEHNDFSSKLSDLISNKNMKKNKISENLIKFYLEMMSNSENPKTRISLINDKVNDMSVKLQDLSEDDNDNEIDIVPNLT